MSYFQPALLSAQTSERVAVSGDAPLVENPIVVLLDPEGSPLARRLQQELEALGFEVRVRSGRSSALDEELHAPNVIAAIEVRPARSGQVDLVVAAPSSPDLIRRSLPIEARQDPAAAELVATRTVELLRAVRLELEAAREQERARPERVVPARETEGDVTPVEPAPGAVLSGGAALSGAPPFGPGASGWFAFGWRTNAEWSLVLELSVPLIASSVARAEGEVEVTMSSYRAGAWLESSRAAWFGAGAGAGLALESVAFRGYAVEPYVSDDSRTWTWGPWMRAGVALRLSPRSRALASATLGLSLPTTTVRLAGREFTRFGAPSLHAALGLEWAL